MDQQFNNTLTNQTEGDVQRPAFLKVLCILSFVMCGLWIIVFLFGWLISMNINSEAISQVWEKILAEEPRLADVDPMAFMAEVSKVCLFFLLANIVSLVGVMLMWRMNKMGFFIYVAAELVTNFINFNVEIPNEQKSYMGLIFYLIIDIAFFVLYAMNLKPFKRSV
jgi:hypothetical protein